MAAKKTTKDTSSGPKKTPRPRRTARPRAAARAQVAAEQPMKDDPPNSGGTRVSNGNLVAGVATVTFSARYMAVEIKSLSSTAGEVWYIRTDGVTPASPWNDCYAMAAGERVLVL